MAEALPTPRDAEKALQAHLQPGERVEALAFGWHLRRPRWVLRLAEALRRLGTAGVLLLYPFAFATRRERWLIAVTDGAIRAAPWRGPGRLGRPRAWPHPQAAARVRAAGELYRIDLPAGREQWSIVLGPAVGTPAEQAQRLCARLLALPDGTACSGA